MKALVTHLAASLVANPNEVMVTEKAEENGALLELRVAPDDVTLVIGKQGRTARAMRALVSAAGAKKGGRFFLKILSDNAFPESSETPRDIPEPGASEA